MGEVCADIVGALPAEKVKSNLKEGLFSGMGKGKLAKTPFVNQRVNFVLDPKAEIELTHANNFREAVLRSKHRECL
jgi:hypothetical protein